ncbi:cobyrinic acid a,c-diamide synthase [Raineyella antarctica]|uniref:Hydrogenobyrinate a,c-diamide synthase n=1 Tax=Raineyella antarctica TaxID=1577474 RepID=A0A1G6GFK3_9ACTN|nr:Rv2231c family pyridoxal phosphate-dependent protein CobC [Raineyella antarctica]SDB80545.1 cobyrinic acid a,c-diamide synthase [Raineyella antarctica]
MSEQTPLARVVIAAPASGQGKTTVATGLMAALSRQPYGLDVAGFKVGPDYIDPGYHALATGHPGRNLDPWMQGEERIVPLLLHGSQHPVAARVAIIEGAMGLFDGKLGTDGYASTAHIVALTESPVILTVDISHASRTIAATVGGLAAFEEQVRINGVILNKAGSTRHADEVKRALKRLGIPVLGVLPRDEAIHVPSRHLGLVPAAERDEALAALDALAQRISDNVDLARVVKIAMTAPRLSGPAWDPAAEVHPPTHPTDSTGPGATTEPPARPRIAVAGGRAFTFRYAETTELMEAAGCEPVEFDPINDPMLPAGTAGIYLGGGFPEVHADDLSTNAPMIASMREAIAAGTPTVGECAGLLYLCREVDGHPMVGAVEASAEMTPKLTLGYVEVEGTRGHEFHRTATDPAEPAMPANVHASYLHVHWAGNPELAQEFCDAVHAYDAARPDLDHHGDTEVGEGLVDLAVNVRTPTPPAWLSEVIAATIPQLGAYPDATAAREAIAAHHGVTPDMVLPTAGAAEAFTLVARAIPGEHPVVVHPQFTEPEAALLAAGRTPHRHVLAPPFTLDVDELPETDLLLVGNPTNPTSVLHDGESLWRLAQPGRIVVIDEAFMDSVPGEHESQIDAEMDSLLVLRSLTKTWGLAGLRAGYVVGDPALIRLLAAQQPPWSVSSPALAAMVACTTDRALVESQLAVITTTRHRDHLVEALTGLGWGVVTPAEGPFVLADTHDPGMRRRLRERGFAVRRGDTFPGLGPSWVRVAVREPSVTDALVEAARV